jgi:hypothetical protein
VLAGAGGIEPPNSGIKIRRIREQNLSLTDDGEMLLRLARPVLDGLENI